MEKYTLYVPGLYADHHTTAVREHLAKFPGISDMYVSSAWRQISVQYDPQQVKPEEIEARLTALGYMQEDSEFAPCESDGDPALRYTAIHPGVGDTLSFADPPLAPKGSLWPCPGIEITAAAHED